jgi:hypothetical protein
MALSTRDWRAIIERAIRSPLPDPTWDELVEERYIRGLEDGGYTVDEVVAVVRKWNKIAPAAIARTGRRVQPRDDSPLLDGVNRRLLAVAEIVAARAGRSLKTEQFRRRWLNDELLRDQDVTPWIEATYDAQIPQDWPRDTGPADATNFPGKFALWPHEHVRLQWMHDNMTMKVWCVPTTGALADLAELSEKLADTWEWSVPLATHFVLTGATPARPGVRNLSFRRRRGSDSRYGMYDLYSVRATLDIEVTPEELAAWWRGVRDHLGVSGRKPVREKSIALALSELTVNEKTSYEQDMHAWNRVHPEWSFDDRRNYLRARRAAWDALNCPAKDVQV